MKIACLGWGSLIWNPENLPIKSEWFTNGPLLPIEFTRQSNDGRLTLVITKDAKPLVTLWALMTSTDLEDAKQSLATRENIGENNINRDIGSIQKDEITEVEIEIIIQKWLKDLNLDAAIWTNLNPKFNRKDISPTLDTAVKYLKDLKNAEIMRRAEEYIRKAPRQIDTEFRRKFEAEFGWNPID